MSNWGAIEDVRADLAKLSAHLEHTQQHFAKVCEAQATHLQQHFDRELQDVRGHLRSIELRLPLEVEKSIHENREDRHDRINESTPPPISRAVSVNNADSGEQRRGNNEHAVDISTLSHVADGTPQKYEGQEVSK